jgi:hypothetical protein
MAGGFALGDAHGQAAGGLYQHQINFKNVEIERILGDLKKKDQ